MNTIKTKKQKQTTYGQTWHAGAVALFAHGRFVCCYASAIDDGDGFDGHTDLAASLQQESGVETGVGTAVWLHSRQTQTTAIHCQKTKVATCTCVCVDYLGSCEETSCLSQTQEQSNRK